MQSLIGILSFATAVLLSPLTESGITNVIREECEADNYRPWSYNGQTNDPSNWGEKYPDCYGRSQSPIDISYENVKRDPKLKKLKMSNYEIPITKAKIVNNGHSVQITPQDGVSRTIQADGKTFTLQQLHFHWGNLYYEGSEHSLDGKKYSMEGHLVHTTKRNESAVVAIIFKAWERNNTALKPIVDALPNIPYENDEVQLTSNLNLNSLVPDNPSAFYRYQGSLTTPGCTEGVVWSILKGIKDVGAQQLYEFRNLYSATKEEATPGCKLTNNFRPLQPLNDRVIYSSA